MGKLIKIRKGKDINLVGEAAKNTVAAPRSASYAIKPADFKGIVPKMMVKAGEEVKAGTPLFHHKTNPSLVFSSPVSGEVAEIVRGDRRVILEVRILADSENSYVSLGTGDPSQMNRDEVIARIQSSGAWPLIRQRPFNIIADPLDKPKAVFISAFDSSPLAPDYSYTLKEEQAAMQAGIDALRTASGANVSMGLKFGNPDNGVFSGLNNVSFYEVDGPHPAGNVGVQIHHVNPVNKGDVVWVVNPQDVVVIGRLFTEGRYRNQKTLAVTGSQVVTPQYYTVFSGASVASLLDGNKKDGNNRIISGNVLTGTKVAADGYISFYENQLTVIPEGDDYEFLGWLVPSYPRPSISKTFLNYLMPNKKFVVNTNTHGEERAFVVTGEYNKVLPMDILPVHLLKAILARDFEAMENLGIYEVVEEDFALCEFVCTSKIDVQEIIKEGLEMVALEG